MGRIRIESLLFAALLALPVSCTIKEDRTDCPCLLTVDLSRTLDAGITPPSWWDKGLQIVLFKDHNPVLKSSLSLSQAQPECDFRVEKGDVGVAGILGLDAGVLSGSEIRYREGGQSDRLYVSSRVVPCYGETARTVLEMYKQFSNIEILGLDSFGLRMEVTAGCDGLDVLAQNAIPLGAYLTAIGYDWHAPSLSDVSVSVDFVTASISITVGDWSQTIEFPYTL